MDQEVVPVLAVRSSEGVSLATYQGTSLQPSDVISSSRDCRVFTFSPNGSLLAWCDGNSVQVLDLHTKTLKCEILKPRARYLQFSPGGTYLAVWEPYVVSKDIPAGTSNLEIWTTEKVADFIQKKAQDWCPQWTEDEQLCSRNVTNEVHCFDGGQPGRTSDRKLWVEGLTTFALSPGSPPYKIAVYVPGRKGAPSFVRLFEYPRLDGPGAIVASKSFYRADNVNFIWNKKGSAVLVLTTTDVDKTGASYYGEQGLHYLSARGDGNTVPLSKKGPIYAVEWNPDSEEFCVVYGFMPSKATLFNCKCEPIHDFGTAHRNIAHFNTHGNNCSLCDYFSLAFHILQRRVDAKKAKQAMISVLCMAGFGNLRGNMEFWDRKTLKLLGSPQAADSTLVEWCPDGIHVVTATTAPRLREGNGLKVWHFSGSLVLQQDTPPKHELWELTWRPCPPDAFPTPDTTARPPPTTAGISKPQAKPQAYRPPALRGKPSTSKPTSSEDKQSTEKLSKSALKNKRKVESKQRARQQDTESGRSQEQQDAVSMATHVLGSASGGKSEGVSDKEKKLKNLKKKLRQVEQLKQQEAEGKQLEANQKEKLKSEQALLDEISRLELAN